jgi:hypothetical protein
MATALRGHAWDWTLESHRQPTTSRTWPRKAMAMAHQ